MTTATAIATQSAVRLPSIDHGLSPFTEAGMLLPLRRGSLTDPLTHAHTTAKAFNGAQDIALGLTAASSGRLSAGYPHAVSGPGIPWQGPQGGNAAIVSAPNEGEGYARGYPQPAAPYAHQKMSTFPQQHGLKRKSQDDEDEGGYYASQRVYDGNGNYYEPTSGLRRVSNAESIEADSKERETNGPGYSFPIAGGSMGQTPISPTSAHHQPLSSYSFGRPTSANQLVAGDGNDAHSINRVALSQPHSPDSSADSSLPPELRSRAAAIFGHGGNATDSDSQMPSHAGKLRLPEHAHLSALRKDSPYSRSPELKVSHKMAERKRRKEMKDLFDDLRDSIPSEKGIKCSKWEILSKGIDYIAKLHSEREELQMGFNEARMNVSSLEQALQHARSQLQSTQNQLNQLQQQQQQQQHQNQHSQHQMSLSPVSSHHSISHLQHPAHPAHPAHPGHQWSQSPSNSYNHIPAHHRSQSHGTALAGGHTAMSAPPALPASNNPFSSQEARPPSLHSHSSNQSVHSMHSMHSHHSNNSPAPVPMHMPQPMSAHPHQGIHHSHSHSGSQMMSPPPIPMPIAIPISTPHLHHPQPPQQAGMMPPPNLPHSNTQLEDFNPFAHTAPQQPPY